MIEAPKTTLQSDGKKLGFVDTVVGAGRALKKTVKTIRTWRAEGGESAGFLPDGRINLDVLAAWAAARTRKRRGKIENKDLLTLEQIRKLKLRNDKEEGTLVLRAKVTQCMFQAAARVNAARLKSEAEHPTKFAAAAGDVPACRTIIQGIWDEIMLDLQALGKDFETCA